MKKLILFTFTFVLTTGAFSQFTFSNGTSYLPTSFVLGEHPIAITDFNGDGFDDIVVLDDFIIFFQGPDSGMFTELDLGYSDGSSAWGMCAGDFDNDGYTDILYGGSFNGLSVVKRSAFINYYTRTNHDESDFMIFLQGVNFADIDNDGFLDIFACHDVGPSRVYLGDGAGGFERNTEIIDTELNGGGENDSGNYGSLFTDINNDGLIDLFVAKCRQGVSDDTDPRRINILFINNGDGTFTEEADDWGLASGEQTWSADFGDIDNDGDMDLLLGQHSNEKVQVYENNGDGTFSDITLAAGLSNSFTPHVIQSKFTDFDNDGYLDIIIAGSSEFMFAHNNGDNTFSIVDDTQIFSTMNSFALGDLNHDGFVDVYSTPGGYGGGWGEGTDSLYLNDGNDNKFLNFDLEGVVSNRDGIGARIVIHGSFGMQMREIRSGESYGIQNSLTAHFGVGAASTIDSAFVYWPSGIIDNLGVTHTNQFLTIVEGAHPVGVFNIKKQDISINIYPNPSSDLVNIVFKNDLITEQNTIEIQIIDQSGKELIRRSNIELINTIDLQNFNSGVYIINIWEENKLIGSEKLTVN